jgi:hypothetical protein
MPSSDWTGRKIEVAVWAVLVVAFALHPSTDALQRTLLVAAIVLGTRCCTTRAFAAIGDAVRYAYWCGRTDRDTDAR